MNLDWLDAFLVGGLFSVMLVGGLGLLLHLQLGLTRVANFGVVGFWGIGMYAYGVLYVQVDWPFGDPWRFILAALFGIFVAGLAGALIGWLIAGMDTDGVMVTTLGFATIVWILATTQKDLTNGALGLGGLRFPYDIGSVKSNELLWLGILTLVVGVILWYVWKVHRSPYGRMLIGVGGNEPLARSLGKPAFRSKLWMFAVTSAGMGCLGVMFGVMERFLETSNLGIDLTLAAFVALVLGGSARIWGAIVGAILSIGFFDIVVQSYLPLPLEWYGHTIPVLREAVFGAALIVVLLYRPLGILGDMRRDKLMRSLHG